MRLTLGIALSCSVLSSCAALDAAGPRTPAAVSVGEESLKPLAGLVTLTQPETPQSALAFDVKEDTLWRVYVVNATDNQIMGMILDGRQIWFDSPFSRTCATNPPDLCANDESNQRVILIQACSQFQETLVLVYRDSRDNQVYRSSGVNLAPKCATRGAMIMFRQN